MIEPRLYQVPPQASQVTAASSTIDPPDWVLGPSHIVTSLPPPPGGCLGNVTKPALSHTLRAPLPAPKVPTPCILCRQSHQKHTSDRPKSKGLVQKPVPISKLQIWKLSTSRTCETASDFNFKSPPSSHTCEPPPRTHSHPLNTPFFSSPCTSSHPLSHHSEFPFQPPRPPPRTSSILWLPLYTASTPLNTNGKYCFSTPSPIVSIKSTYLLSQDTHFFLRPCITQGLSNQTSIFPN